MTARIQSSHAAPRRMAAPPAPARGFIERRSAARPFCRRHLDFVTAVHRVDLKDGEGQPDTIEICDRCVRRPDHDGWIANVEKNRRRLAAFAAQRRAAPPPPREDEEAVAALVGGRR